MRPGTHSITRQSPPTAAGHVDCPGCEDGLYAVAVACNSDACWAGRSTPQLPRTATASAAQICCRVVAIRYPIDSLPVERRDERRGQSFRSSPSSNEGIQRSSRSYATRRKKRRPLDPVVIRLFGRRSVQPTVGPAVYPNQKPSEPTNIRRGARGGIDPRQFPGRQTSTRKHHHMNRRRC